MAPLKYVIVGAEVDETTRYLKPDGTITATAGPGHVPLNVEFIGALMVRLSELGKAAVPAADLAKYEAQVKNALMVRPLGVPDNRLTSQKKQEILDNTTVAIEFETRNASPDAAAPDVNRRILVVPSDETLKLKEADLQAESGGPGFAPPLAYDLDIMLMLAYLEETVTAIFDTFTPEPAFSEGVKAKFKKHVEDEIKSRTTALVEGGAPSDSVINQILNSPVRAFHRSVGIYATNMCR